MSVIIALASGIIFFILAAIVLNMPYRFKEIKEDLEDDDKKKSSKIKAQEESEYDQITGGRVEGTLPRLEKVRTDLSLCTVFSDGPTHYKLKWQKRPLLDELHSSIYGFYEYGKDGDQHVANHTTAVLYRNSAKLYDQLVEMTRLLDGGDVMNPLDVLKRAKKLLCQIESEASGRKTQKTEAKEIEEMVKNIVQL